MVRVSSITLALFMSLLVQKCYAQDSLINDGPLFRSGAAFIAEAQILDYDSRLGFTGTIQIRRGNSFFISRPIEANKNRSVGVRTTAPNRFYEITVFYRGQVARTTVQATNPRRRVIFTYTSRDGLRLGR